MSAKISREFAEEGARFLEAWTRSIVDKDVEAASALRARDYRCILPDRRVLTRAEDLAMIAAPGTDSRLLRTELVSASANGNHGLLKFVLSIGAEEGSRAVFDAELSLVRKGEAWLAGELAMTDAYRAPKPAARGRFRSMLRRLALSGRGGPAPGFQELAYRPYRPGLDYQLSRSRRPDPVYDEAELPLPPPELWLGYNYPQHGRLHVDAMWRVLETGGFQVQPGDRILDLGCGAGRMIRHLAPLARTCEIWGSDISAEHILWCQRHLSPPFHFLTNTKAPQLPFADGSFRLIYCGSLFTHIDDMARAWLLELRRLLADDGCAYITIHDENTIRLFEGMTSPPDIVRHIMSSPSWAQAKDGSDMFTIGRDEQSQVFYAQDWFARLLEPMFEIVAVAPEAYFYQTAVLVRPRRAERPGQP